MELLAGAVERTAGSSDEAEALRTKVETLRTQLHWNYTRLDEPEPITGDGEAARFPVLAPAQPEVVRRLESEYLQARRQLQLMESGSAGDAETTSLREIQRLLGQDERLVEFIATRDELLAFVVGPREFRTVRGLASRAEVEELGSRLRFQWSRFGLGPMRGVSPAPVQATLEALYNLLLLPLEPWLEVCRRASSAAQKQPEAAATGPPPGGASIERASSRTPSTSCPLGLQHVRKIEESGVLQSCAAR